jgi:hypothetical protein
MGYRLSEINHAFGIPSEQPTPNIRAELEFGARPIRRSCTTKDGGRRLEVIRWGLIR